MPLLHSRSRWANGFLIALLFAATRPAAAQGLRIDSSVAISGSVELYGAVQPAAAGVNDAPGFLYHHTRINEVAVNLAFVRVKYGTSTTRASVAVMTGSYASANLAAEPAVYRGIFEANAGALIVPSTGVWLDAGIMPSHIGFESAVGKDNWTVTRSLLAENSPYYETGARLSRSTDGGRWSYAVFVLNGWQQIQRPAGRTNLCWGTQVTFQPGNGIILNSSTFFGNTNPDSVSAFRAFHNFYAIVPVTTSLGIIVGIDAGISKRPPGVGGHVTWWSPVVVVRAVLDDAFTVAGRAEYFADRNGVIIATGTPHGFQVFGASVNLDYAITPQTLLRFEGRLLEGRDAFYTNGGGPSSRLPSIVGSLNVSF